MYANTGGHDGHHGAGIAAPYAGRPADALPHLELAWMLAPDDTWRLNALYELRERIVGAGAESEDMRLLLFPHHAGMLSLTLPGLGARFIDVLNDGPVGVAFVACRTASPDAAPKHPVDTKSLHARHIALAAV